MEMPPKEPLIYRLYEIVQNYGYAYKAVMNEKFGDGIMSAISFSTHVEKETDDKGEWVKITLRGKWYVLFLRLVLWIWLMLLGCRSHGSRVYVAELWHMTMTNGYSFLLLASHRLFARTWDVLGSETCNRWLSTSDPLSDSMENRKALV